jgi:hypothetical protein
MSEIGILAQEVVNDELSYLDESQQNLSISRASGWMVNNLGILNNYIFTSYSGENPGLKYEESSIYKLIYLKNYYKNKAGSVLKNMDSDNLQWLSLKEGDSQINLQNKNEVAKTYIQMSKEKDSEIQKLIWTYNLYQAYPREVDVNYYEYKSNSSSTNSQIINSSTINGYVDIQSGQNYIYIPISLLNEKPKEINLTLIKPSETSPNFSYSVVGASISETGFKVSFGAIVNQTGYQINYGVK